MFDYIEMVDYFLSIINNIQKVQSQLMYSEDCDECVKEDAKKDYDDCYWSFERAYDRLDIVKKLIDLKDEEDFEYFALYDIKHSKGRIEHFLNDALLTYPEHVYELDKYDNILVDYFENDCKEYSNAISKYFNIEYRRSCVNLGIVHDIDHLYSLIDESDDNGDFKVLDEIVVLVKQLSDFIPAVDKDDSFVNYERWSE